MACNEGGDPADFAAGGKDPIDDPTTPDPDISIINGVVTNANPGKVQFAVVLSNEHDVNVQVRWDTSNGAAQAGIHYTAQINQTLIIPAGDTEATVEVDLLAGVNYTGNYNFNVTLSNPVNCQLSDTVAEVWVPFPRGSSPPPPPPDDGSYTGFTRINSLVYDQFVGGCYTYACTGAAVGAAVSGLIQHHGGGNVPLNWKKLYTDAGGCISCGNTCDGENWITMLRHMKYTGIKEQDSSTFHTANFSEIQRNNGKTYVLNQIKDAVRDNGVVYLCSPWYSNLSAGIKGWNRCWSCNGFVLQNPDDDGPFGKNTSPGIGGTSDACDNMRSLPSAAFGHCWVITGWNNNKANGAFEIQHSDGTDWGSGGRGWMPYSYLGTSGKWHYYRLTYTGHN